MDNRWSELAETDPLLMSELSVLTSAYPVAAVAWGAAGPCTDAGASRCAIAAGALDALIAPPPPAHPAARLPTINKERLHNGKITIEQAHLNDVDLHQLMDAVRSAKDGEYVTVQGGEQDVRVAKQGGHLLVNVTEKEKKNVLKKMLPLTAPSLL